MAKGFGVIGTGLWGEFHALIYSTHPGCELVAVCDTNAQRAAEIAKKYGAKDCYTDYRDLLADKRIEAVTIATPDHLHREIGVAAARAGKHILMEKPLALTVEDCRAVIDAAREAGVKLMVDFHNHWNPAFNLLKQDLDAGKLGEPLLVTGKQNNTIFVPTQMLSWAGNSATIWFTGSHLIDILCWLVGSKVSRVYSVSRSKVLVARGITTPDFFETTLEFANGAVGVAENCWILPNSEPTVVELKLRFVGTEGSASIDGFNNRTLEEYGPERGQYRDVLGMVQVFDQLKGFALESIKYFADCVLNDRTPYPDGDAGLHNTAIIVAALESVRTGQPVNVTEG